MRKLSPAIFFVSALLAPMLAPAQAQPQSCNIAGRAIAMVMDASGSMNARLPNGETRIDVAKRAIKGVATLVPPQAQLSLRLYGAQSASSQKNCQDTNLAVPSGPAGAAGGPISKSIDALKAQGYTPIAYSLGQVERDFPADAKERVVVLVSDGKETCQGDPVLAARALATKGITVHTVGFIVDTAARMQLQAIATATGGTYFDAPVGPELPDTLKSALNACKATVVTLPPKPQPGRLRTTAAMWLTAHAVTNSETKQQVGTLDSNNKEISLPAGIYEVKFGPGSWKGIEVRSGQTTTISPAVLTMAKNVQAALVDSETGEVHGSLNSGMSSLTVMPGLYDLKFHGTEWRFIKLDGDKTVTLNPVEISIVGPLGYSSKAHVLLDGKVVESFNFAKKTVRLPPGNYVVEVDGNKVPFPAPNGGEVLEVKTQ
jgi:hypothetical protein